MRAIEGATLTVRYDHCDVVDTAEQDAVRAELADQPPPTDLDGVIALRQASATAGVSAYEKVDVVVTVEWHVALTVAASELEKREEFQKEIARLDAKDQLTEEEAIQRARAGLALQWVPSAEGFHVVSGTALLPGDVETTIAIDTWKRF